jgi:hypothetical protein
MTDFKSLASGEKSISELHSAHCHFLGDESLEVGAPFRRRKWMGWMFRGMMIKSKNIQLLGFLAGFI